MVPYLVTGGIGVFINIDDNAYIYENSQVMAGVTAAGIRWAFTTFHAANWHPLAWLSHMIDVSLFGVNPWAHHFVSSLLHALSTALLCLALYRMTAALWSSALVAGLFALHPLHTESVAWAAERKDVLSGLFFMLILLAYERYVRRPGRGRYAFVLLLFALGLMAKSMLVTVPCLLLLLDVWPLGRAGWPGDARAVTAGRAGWVRLLGEKLPLFALAAGASVLTMLAQRGGAAVVAIDIVRPGTRLANVLVSYATYLARIFWPAGLSFFYPFYPGMHPAWKVAGAALVLGAITAVAIHWFRRRPYLLLGWLWYLGMLVPVIGLVQVGSQAMADRYTYLPLIGAFIALVWCLAELLPARLHAAAATGAASLLLVLGALTTAQVRYWQDNFALFDRTLAVTRNSSFIENAYGLLLNSKGRHREASERYRRALQIRPFHPDALYYLGRTLNLLDEPAEAATRLQAAAAVAPRPAVFNDLGLVLAGLGRLEEAVAAYREALKLAPGFASGYYNLAVTLDQAGKREEAIASYREALRLAPDLYDAHFNLALIFAQSGRLEDGAAHLLETIRVRPDHAEARYNLGIVLTLLGRNEEAVTHYREAIRLQPGLGKAHDALGRLLAKMGRSGESAFHLSEARRLQALAAR